MLTFILKLRINFIISIVLFFFSIASAQYSTQIKLPAPQTEIGKPLMQALKLRQSSRSFDTKPLPLQEISNLLWAAYGINRPESGKRTAPSAMNWQEIEIYIALSNGVYIYEAKENILNLMIEEDLRAFCGTQSFVKDAPVNFVYVADLSKILRASDEDKILYTAADCGFIAQNVYLYCASQGLAVVVRGSVDKAKLSNALKLKPDQKIILTQTVGYPK